LLLEEVEVDMVELVVIGHQEVVLVDIEILIQQKHLVEIHQLKHQLLLQTVQLILLLLVQVEVLVQVMV
jgi:DNA polymerase III delta subunit